jgi:AcrR family transcriptional regulator
MDRMSAASIRARVRAEMTEEIKSIARRHLASDGANLSLRAVARDLGVVSSAIYRYFASRDELLTALIIDAYNSLGEAVERADGGQPPEQLQARWLAVAHAVRDWALAQPHEYALIYGSPVPGYQAPRDTVGPATRGTFVLGGILSDGVELGLLDASDETLPETVRQDLSALRELAFPNVPEPLLARGMGAWVLIFGAVSFELFGQFDTVLNDRRAFFDYQMRNAYAQITAGAAQSG